MSMVLPQQMSLPPAYELDSVNEDMLEALIMQLGLKRHSKNSMDPCCVICRQNLFLSKQVPPLRPVKPLNDATAYGRFMPNS